MVYLYNRPHGVLHDMSPETCLVHNKQSINFGYYFHQAVFHEARDLIRFVHHFILGAQPKTRLLQVLQKVCLMTEYVQIYPDTRFSFSSHLYHSTPIGSVIANQGSFLRVQILQITAVKEGGQNLQDQEKETREFFLRQCIPGKIFSRKYWNKSKCHHKVVTEIFPLKFEKVNNNSDKSCKRQF